MWLVVCCTLTVRKFRLELSKVRLISSPAVRKGLKLCLDRGEGGEERKGIVSRNRDDPEEIPLLLSPLQFREIVLGIPSESGRRRGRKRRRRKRDVTFIEVWRIDGKENLRTVQIKDVKGLFSISLSLCDYAGSRW